MTPALLFMPLVAGDSMRRWSRHPNPHSYRELIMTTPPQASIWLDIPNDCHIQSEFNGERDIQITLGQFGEVQQTLLFEREALKRFVKLATDILAVPLPEDRMADLPVLVA
jgi:hypothetical protein